MMTTPSIRKKCFHCGLYIFASMIFLSIVYNSLLSRFDIQTFNSIRITVNRGDVGKAEFVGCQFPDINPLDPSILKYIEHPKPVECPQIQPFMTFIDSDGYLQINKTEVEQQLHYFNFSNFACFYKTFDRASGTDDNDYAFSSEHQLTKPVKLAQDMVQVKCSASTNGTVKDDFYFNLHAHPAITTDRKFGTPTENKLSILLMVIDSVSFSVLKRNMPLTFDYITNKMGMFMFKRFNKIGDNTFPNMIAILTGKRAYHEQADMPAELGSTENMTYFDHYPLIFKNFSDSGYATVFNEDMPQWGLFHYLTDGFKRKMMDYYYHTYWYAIRRASRKRNYKEFCFNNVPNGDILIDITKRHLKSLNSSLQFIYSFFVQYSHDDGNGPEKADLLYLEFWKEMFESGYLNNTAVIFMSDHGHRFSDIRETLVGLLEERNPFFGLWFPQWFYELHPYIYRSLKLNAGRLSSTFDIHETLKDILTGSFENTQRNRTNRGLSQLYELPLDRTCNEAGIPDHYCLCVKEQPLNVALRSVADAAKATEDHINFLLKPLKKCRKVFYKKILRAENLDFDQKVKDGLTHREVSKLTTVSQSKEDDSDVEVKRIRVAIETQPNNAIFEATLSFNTTEESWMVEGDIQRLSEYSNSSYCITQVILRKLCTCKSHDD